MLSVDIKKTPFYQMGIGDGVETKYRINYKAVRSYQKKIKSIK